MKTSFYNLATLLLGSIILLALAGCARMRPPVGHQDVTTSVSSVITPTSFAGEQTPTEVITLTLALPTPLPAPTATQTAFPTSTLTSTPTWTPAPTLSPQDAHALVQDLLENNDGCQLPCWWGMTPGQTRWNTARHFLETFVISIEQNGEQQTVVNGVITHQIYYYVRYEVEDGIEIVFGVLVENGVIKSVITGEHGAKSSFRLHKLLTNYGAPDEVFIRAHRYTNDGSPPPFDFILYYARKHFWAHFMLEGKLVGDKLLGCPQSIDPRIWVGAPDREWTLDELFNYALGPPVPGFPAYPTLTLEEATELDLETFTNVFRDPDNRSCLETPADLWY